MFSAVCARMHGGNDYRICVAEAVLVADNADAYA